MFDQEGCPLRRPKLSDTKGLLLGILFSWITCLLLVAVISQLALNGKAGEKGVEIGINISVLVTALTGSCVFTILSDKKSLLCCLLLPLVLFVLLLIVAFVLDGTLRNVAIRLTTLLLGGVITYAVSIKKGRKVKTQKRRYR